MILWDNFSPAFPYLISITRLLDINNISQAVGRIGSKPQYKGFLVGAGGLRVTFT